ncbi:MAG: trypsin-like peptidase domain-containing protein [Candidatus Taylorbacteria bacterium]|nr:trypsin-like peptidase domain-containing protein [Candidatus Taylorbacteria bacterium]
MNIEQKLLTAGILTLTTLASLTYVNLDLTDSVNQLGAVSASNIKKKDSFNLFTIPSLPLFNLKAPAFSIIPLEKLPTYQIKKLPQNTLELIQDRISHTAPSPIKTTNTIAETLSTFKDSSRNVENAAVNIFCSQRIGKQRRTITGSGVLIHKDGTVLTNAHVAQYPLLSDSDKNIVCIARSGLKAEKTYGVKTMFISPEWSFKNAPYIKSGGTTQTGEHDYALLKLISSENIDITPLTLSFSGTNVGDKVQLVSYPADVLAVNPQSALTRQKDNLTLLSYYSLGLSQKDAFSTNETTLAQRGSSGGLVANMENQLLGIVSIVTHVTGSTQKQIRGITVNHINDAISVHVKDGLIQASNEGSLRIANYFDTSYRAELTSLFAKYLNQ